MAVIRQFDMETGEPVKEIRIEDAPWINDIEVKEDGTIYATQTGDFFGADPNPETGKVWKVTPDGKETVFVQGKPHNAPNGLDFYTEGNMLVANYGNAEELTYSEDGKLFKWNTSTHHQRRDIWQMQEQP